MCHKYRVGRNFLLGLVLAAVPFAQGVAGVSVTGARVGAYPAKTRFVLDLSGSLAYQVFALADPYRIVVDLPEVEWKLDPRAKIRRGLVTGFRYGLFAPGKSRMVIDVGAPVRVSKSFLLAPNGRYGYRLVLDFRKVTRETFLRDVRRRPPGPEARARPPPAPPTRRRDRGRPVIAIDPGHGGVDPGAIGASGSREKHINLAFARELRRRFIAGGRYRVVMTRNRDVFVRLRERIAIAQRAGAGLFISLHADSMENRRIRGGSVYTLSETASDAEAAALAARENKADVIAGLDLSDQSPVVAKILIDLRQRLTMNQSAIFASGLVRELGKSVRMLRNTHRFAGFAVLKAPEIPSVLVELGYLSNATDERLLRHPGHRRRVAAAIVRAVNTYFTRQQASGQP